MAGDIVYRARNDWTMRPRRSAMTLIEVLVAMVILGTLLASAVTARSRYIMQAVRASHKQRAVAAADALLRKWSFDWASQSTDASGPVTNEPTFAWRRQILDRADAQDVGVRVLRLEITDSSTGSQPASDGNLLACVEVLVPLEPRTTTTGQTSPPG